MRPANLGVRMTNSTRLFATALTLGVTALAAPAFAQHASGGGYAPMVGATDPCVLGTNVQPGACVGPVRVAPMIMSQGAVQLQPTYAPQPTYAAQPIAYQQPVMMAPPQQAPVQMAGCVPGYGGPNVPCNGNWVYANQAAPQPMMQPAPHYAPAPQYLRAPIAYAPQPQQVGMIPTSFFTGGITYGAGFPTDTTYVSGGGGYGYSSGGGTRFSGVRERSPTPLIPPPRRQRHAPPAHHHGCGC
jgi:hypothetical protein